MYIDTHQVSGLERKTARILSPVVSDYERARRLQKHQSLGG